MFGFAVRGRQNGPGSPKQSNSPKADIGEIDTAAPFESVKAAVSLFGEVGSAKANPVTKKSKAEERVLEKETQHHMVVRELEYYKDRLKIAETAKAQALRDLQRANRTLQQLTNKLETLSESTKESIKAAEAANVRAKELEEQKSLRAQLGPEAWRLDVDCERERHKACTGELNSSKQELTNLRQDIDAVIEAKLATFQKAEEAQHTSQNKQERQSQLEKEVASLRDTLDQVKLASHQAEEQHSKIIAEKEVCLLARKSATEEARLEIKRLKEEYEPRGVLEVKLKQTNDEISVLQEQLKDVHAKKTLQQLVAEENSIRNSLDSVKLQLEEVKRELLESEERALKAESSVEQMRAELEKRKSELEAVISGSTFGMKSKIEKLSAEAEKARHDEKDMKKNAQLFKQEAEAARIAAKESEEKLKTALKEADEAMAAQKLANEKISNYQRTDSGSVRKIKLSVEEFELMNKKIDDLRNQADEKVKTALIQVETINASEKGVLQKLEVVSKENEAINLEIEDVMKRTEMAEAAKKAVECELQKWRQRTEQSWSNFS